MSLDEAVRKLSEDTGGADAAEELLYADVPDIEAVASRYSLETDYLIVNSHVLLEDVADSIYLRPLLVVELSEVGEYGLELCHNVSTIGCRLELLDIELDLHLVGFAGDEQDRSSPENECPPHVSS